MAFNKLLCSLKVRFGDCGIANSFVNYWTKVFEDLIENTMFTDNTYRVQNILMKSLNRKGGYVCHFHRQLQPWLVNLFGFGKSPIGNREVESNSPCFFKP